MITGIIFHIEYDTTDDFFQLRITLDCQSKDKAYSVEFNPYYDELTDYPVEKLLTPISELWQTLGEFGKALNIKPVGTFSFIWDSTTKKTVEAIRKQLDEYNRDYATDIILDTDGLLIEEDEEDDE